MGNTLATMLTMTTYGTWLRGDQRGWVDDGKILPADPERESADRARMQHPVYLFPRERLLEVGAFIGKSLIARLGISIQALHVGTWHVHVVIGPTHHDIANVAKCAKDAVCYGLRPGRPIWTDGYDKRSASTTTRPSRASAMSNATTKPQVYRPAPGLSSWFIRSCAQPLPKS